MSDSVARILRTIAQLIAGGALTVAYNAWVKDLDPQWAGFATILFTLLVTVCQNVVEEHVGQGILRPESPPAPKKVEPVANV